MLSPKLNYKLIQLGYLTIDFDPCEEKGNEEKNEARGKEIAAILDSFASLGYGLSPSSLSLLFKVSQATLADFYHSAYMNLKYSKGAHVHHQVFYPSFPHLEDVDPLEYIVNAILHYQTATASSLGYTKEEGDRLYKDFKREVSDFVEVVPTKIGLAALEKTVNALFSSPFAIPRGERYYLEDLFRFYPSLIHPASIPFKENQALYLDLFLDNDLNSLSKDRLRFISTATDWLRAYIVLSKGDITMKGKIKFASLPRRIRKTMLALFEDIAKGNPNIYDELSRREFYFKRAFELLHPGEFASVFPISHEVIKAFRNEDYMTYMGKVEALKKIDKEAYLKLLSAHPGEFLRAFDSILRSDSFDKEIVLSLLRQTGKKAANSLLFDLWEYYQNRPYDSPRRFLIPKKGYFKIHQEKSPLPEIDESLRLEVIKAIEETLRQKYRGYARIEKVYLDPSLRSYCLPRSNRNASSANKTLTYGSKIKLDPLSYPYARFFTHWKNLDGEEESGRVDIDLSAEFFDERFRLSNSLSWHNLAGGAKFDSYHSGDLVTAPNGASEFVSIHLEKARKYARYLLIVNSSFSGQDFASIPECFSGVCFLKEEESREGKLFDPSAVEIKFDLTSTDATQIIAYGIDLKTMELIWIDAPTLDCARSISAANSNNGYVLADALKRKMSLYEFFLLHEGHIGFVEAKEDAEFVISDAPDADLKPFDIETIASKWL